MTDSPLEILRLRDEKELPERMSPESKISDETYLQFGPPLLYNAIDRRGKTMIDLEKHLRRVPDFPKPGVEFIDITTVLKDSDLFRELISQLKDAVADLEIDLVIGTESRGFIMGAPLAYALGVGFVPVRKKGKLPAETISADYELEYGIDTMEIHRDAISPGARVLIVDDLLATGGTAGANCRLVEQLGGRVAALLFFIELSFLHGRDKLTGRDIRTILTI